MRFAAGLLVAGIAVLASGCGPGDPEPADAPVAATTPSDPKLAQLYAQSCKSCHSAAGSGAPQAGDRAAWQPRMAQGMAVLLDRTIAGYKGMPPLGSCGDCTEAEFEALIRFMSGADS